MDQRATCSFWGVMGSSLMVVTRATLVWLLGSRHALPTTVLEICWMMMRPVWGMSGSKSNRAKQRFLSRDRCFQHKLTRSYAQNHVLAGTSSTLPSA